jgi:hypothetical protein
LASRLTVVVEPAKFRNPASLTARLELVGGCVADATDFAIGAVHRGLLVRVAGG